jgi:uncharacterized protein
MNEGKIIGRKYEQKLIKEYYESPKSELVALYGRRRVGKTYLVKTYFDEKFDFSFTGVYEADRKALLKQFGFTLSRYSGRKTGTPGDWYEAFNMLNEYLLSLGKEKVLVFLDELPWMDGKGSDFLQAFSFFWNMWPSKVSMKLFVCGSATTWMMDKLIGDKGGLYGRVSRAIYLAPFTLGETELYLKEMKGIILSRYKILELYMILGGIPYYLDMLSPDIPLSENIDELFFREGAPLKAEFDFLFRSLFRESKSCRKVIEALASKMAGMTNSEIREATGLQGSELSSILVNLSSCDFIRRYVSIGKAERDAVYQLTDLFFLFHLRFVENNDSQDRSFWTNMSSSGAKNAWAGYAFEQVCLHHIREIKARLGILGVLSNVYSWQKKAFTDKDGSEWNGARIDMLIDRNDSVINICEMKYSVGEYVITEEYERKLRERLSLFEHVTKTKKALVLTFITTYGVKRNIHSSIVHSEVPMDDLFRLE